MQEYKMALYWSGGEEHLCDPVHVPRGDLTILKRNSAEHLLNHIAKRYQ